MYPHTEAVNGYMAAAGEPGIMKGPDQGPVDEEVFNADESITNQ